MKSAQSMQQELIDWQWKNIFKLKRQRLLNRTSFICEWKSSYVNSTNLMVELATYSPTLSSVNGSLKVQLPKGRGGSNLR